MKEEAEFKLKSILGEFFRDSFYKEAIINLRKSLAERNDYQRWEKVIRLIINRELEAGKPLSFVHNTANLPLDENSDEEAYKWLTLMLINSMGAEDSPVIEY
ncbi:hypothetical protein [Flagellimonas pelagia]|uniref:Uncharacterized protein n=1 Tax=Flagellimonas pelagia TaxID=2306998 RepID=A0A3A1NI89_9FLAO|nr:hypothetical protein [Allomuricauda maritima]RIV42063.1 hypothetical protein D2V05_18370 [Allomuricauda maritima]TXJ90948.1 hypothetical protein FQ017_18210 [Allomuricauda maritima]